MQRGRVAEKDVEGQKSDNLNKKGRKGKREEDNERNLVS